MANTVKHGKDSRICIGAYDFSGQGRSIDLTVFQADIADATVFTSPARVKSPGSYSAKIDHKGIFTNVVSGWDNWLVSKLGSMSGQPISVLLGQPAEGDIAYHGEILTSNVKVPVKIDDVIATEATYEIHRALARGTLIGYHLGSGVGGVTGTGRQVGAVGADELLQVTAHIHAQDASGAYQLELQQSSGNSVYTALQLAGSNTLLATDNQSDTAACIVARIAGPIDDYVRVRSLASPTTVFAKWVVVASKIHKTE